MMRQLQVAAKCDLRSVMRHVMSCVSANTHATRRPTSVLFLGWMPAGEKAGVFLFRFTCRSGFYLGKSQQKTSSEQGGVVLTTKLVTMAWIWEGIADVVSDVDRVGQPSVVLRRCTELLRGTQLWQGAAVTGRVRVRS